MDELLGFDDEESGNPSSPRYWKNIIPETYNIFDREGTTIIRPSECVDIIGTPDEETDYETISTTCNENIDSQPFESYNYMSVNCCVKTEEDEILECTDDELQSVVMKDGCEQVEIFQQVPVSYLGVRW